MCTRTRHRLTPAHTGMFTCFHNVSQGPECAVSVCETHAGCCIHDRYMDHASSKRSCELHTPCVCSLHEASQCKLDVKRWTIAQPTSECMGMWSTQQFVVFTASTWEDPPGVFCSRSVSGLRSLARQLRALACLSVFRARGGD